MADFLVDLGIKAPDFVAGMAGGIVKAFVFDHGTPMAVVSSVIVGSLTAAYLSEPAARIIGTSGGATAFIVGLTAMAICQMLVAQVTKWKPGTASPKGGPDV